MDSTAQEASFRTCSATEKDEDEMVGSRSKLFAAQRPPPPLIFDDGSRIFRESAEAAAATTIAQSGESDDTGKSANPRGSVSIREYYEIDRLVAEIRALPTATRKTETTQSSTYGTDSSDSDEWTHRIALQFPDNQLCDAPFVTWEFEDALHSRVSKHGTLDANGNDTTTSPRRYLVCILGDTTFAACCPDTVAAAHISATILIHYGHACLSSLETASTSCRVLYSFGKQAIHIDQCQAQVQVAMDELPADFVSTVSAAAAASTCTRLRRRLLLLYQVQYHHEIARLQDALQSLDVLANWTVLAGQIPLPLEANGSCTDVAASPHDSTYTNSCSVQSQPSANDASVIEMGDNPKASTCIAADRASACSTVDASCCRNAQSCASSVARAATSAASTAVSPNRTTSAAHRIIVGGLQLPINITPQGNESNGNDEDWSNCIILYIGDDSSNQFLNIALRFMSSPHRPLSIWTWSPLHSRLATSLSPAFAKVLNRRFYLVQRAQQCRVFGILVAHVTEPIQQLVVSLRQVLDDPRHGDRTSYTFAVGKINPAKLANFPEIECFVMTACPDHSLLSNERELYHVPIITPSELLVALGVTEWGTSAYSTHPSDYWSKVDALFQETSRGEVVLDDHSDADSDAPYFSLVTGTYQAKPNRQTERLETSLAGERSNRGGALVEYRSAAGDFLRGSEYRGLELTTTELLTDSHDNSEHANGSSTKLTAHIALPGQSGIASNYGSR